ncbi:YdcF family protein [Mycobacterium neglectum]|uniref:YdcF family protein n=1 Tax=Mycobacterium neglectum TaxID=242737 RepID=UPI000BFEF8BF|nr:YdcF family protein [Mycobacterium neglectum]
MAIDKIDQLRPADAILILGGRGHDRYSVGLELALEGWAPNLDVSNPHDAEVAWGENYCTAPPANLRMFCFVPDPGTTRGEGRELRRLARQYGWRTVIVVTFRPHISRSRFILEQCFDGDLVMVDSPANLSLKDWTFEYLYQTAGYLRTLVEPEC